ncbi:MAG: hypothetical protein IJR32_03550 [Paludibacteraceae bacterium]|nr:hypothetical protein [Paludibacteraceae bacterium]
MKAKVLFLLVSVAAGSIFVTSCGKKSDKTEGSIQEVQLPNGAVTKGGDTILMVDLGLPSGTKWADRNVGACCSADTGSFFAWGETSEKEDYSWDSYLCSQEQCWTAEDTIFVALEGSKNIAGTQFDAVTANWGKGYSMPTDDQVEELMDTTFTTWSWTSVEDKRGNVINGYKVTGKVNGNSIFLPALGCRKLGEVLDNGVDGHLWTAQRDSFEVNRAGRLKYSNDAIALGHPQRYYGRPVRAVTK